MDHVNEIQSGLAFSVRWITSDDGASFGGDLCAPCFRQWLQLAAEHVETGGWVDIRIDPERVL